MIATFFIVFAGATKELGFHASLKISATVSLVGRDATGEQRRK